MISAEPLLGLSVLQVHRRCSATATGLQAWSAACEVLGTAALDTLLDGVAELQITTTDWGASHHNSRYCSTPGQNADGVRTISTYCSLKALSRLPFCCPSMPCLGQPHRWVERRRLVCWYKTHGGEWNKVPQPVPRQPLCGDTRRYDCFSRRASVELVVTTHHRVLNSSSRHPSSYNPPSPFLPSLAGAERAPQAICELAKPRQSCSS